VGGYLNPNYPLCAYFKDNVGAPGGYTKYDQWIYFRTAYITLFIFKKNKLFFACILFTYSLVVKYLGKLI
jgi:hypothetical protein